MDDDEFRESWKPRLEALMRERGLSKADLARHADVSPPAVSQWFSEGPRRTKELGAMTLLTLCKSLNIRERWLVFGEEPCARGPELSSEAEALIKAIQARADDSPTSRLPRLR